MARRWAAEPDAPGVLERRLRTAIEQSPLAIHVFATDGGSLLANAAWDRLWDLTPGESSEGKNIFEDEQVRASGLLPYVREALAGNAVTTPPLLYDPGRAGRRGPPIWLRAFAYPVKSVGPGGGEEVSEVTLIIEDVTERRELEERLAHRAFHDDLTGLPNRALLQDRLQHALNRAGRGAGGEGVEWSSGRKTALLFMDLDNFKYVNDSLGHEAGDDLLVEVARRLKACTRPEDTVARLGGDEFVVLLEDVSDERETGEIAARISAGLRAPFRLAGRELFVTTSTGVVLAGPDGGPGAADRYGAAGGTPAGCLRAADVAMYRAKRAGKDRYVFFDPSMDGPSEERLTLEGGLRRALEREEFVVRYQPLIEIAGGAVVGYEALVRWEHPERGTVPPSEFVPLAEETGLIVEIGHRVLDAACALAVRLGGGRVRGENLPLGGPPTVWVNLSARQLREPGFPAHAEAALKRHGLCPGRLGLEMTENVAMDEAGLSVEATVAALQRLKALGVRLAIDDFGTGYSSLSHLKRLPVDVLKIDRSFVSGLGGSTDPGDVAIVSAVVALARDMNLLTVGEGVETEEQLAGLRERGCDIAQGYLFSEPLEAGEVPDVASKGRHDG